MGELRQFKSKKSPVKTDTRIESFVEIQQVEVVLPALPQKDLDRLQNHIELQMRLMDIQRHLNGLEGVVPWQLVEESKRGLQSVSFDGLHNIAMQSTPAGWSIKPAYYQALVDTLCLRLESEPAE